MRFEIYEAFNSGSSDGIEWEYESAGWYWRLRARNGRIVADGAEGYASKAGVRRAINRLQDQFAEALTGNTLWGHCIPVVEVES